MRLSWTESSLRMLLPKVRHYIHNPAIDHTTLNPKWQPLVVLTFLLSLLSLCSVVLGSGPDQACLQNALNSSLEGAVDQNGNPTTNISHIVGITYDRCVAACGSGPISAQL